MKEERTNMANQKYIEILKLGIPSWNAWRKGNPATTPDLSYADLSETDLSFANLSFANLIVSDLYKTDLSYADLVATKLSGANLRKANLTGANLGGANLDGAILSEANLEEANLNDADLNEANLSGAMLEGANFTEANLSRTNFTNTVMWGTYLGDHDLRAVEGLETVRHSGPSTMGINTIYLSQGDIPEAFIRGTGVSNEILEYMKTLTNKPFEYYTCFISYSHHNQDFSEKLYKDLQYKGVRCWFAPEDMDIGDKIRPRIVEIIHRYDKLLLVLSEHSIASNWVAYEVERALNKEPNGIPNVLYPIRLDDTILTCTTSWAQDIKDTRHIGDFTDWKNHDAYQKNFNRLLRTLTQKQGN